MKYRWQWQLRNKPQDLWPTLIQIPHPTSAGSSGNFLTKLLLSGTPDDASRETAWVKNHKLIDNQGFKQGHLANINYEMTLEPKGKGSIIHYELEMEPQSALARFALPLFFVKNYQKLLTQSLRKSDFAMLRQKKEGVVSRKAYLPEKRREALKEASLPLLDEKFSEPLVQKLRELIIHEPASNLVVMRPYAYIDQLGIPPRKALKLFLAATRCKILQQYWMVMCPHCKNWGMSCQTMDDIKPKVCCERCKKEYDAILDKNVEIVFQPNPAIRPLPQGAISTSTTPLSAPRIILQQTLRKKGLITLPSPLEHGDYLVRVFGDKKELWQQITIDHASPKELYIEISGEDIILQLHDENNQSAVKIANKTGEEQRIIIEEGVGAREQTTALEAHTCQYFRTYFAALAKPPKESLPASNITFMTVSLSPSHNGLNSQFDGDNTDKLREVYNLEQGIIDFNDGAIVDYMAATISAAFTQPQDAVSAAVALRQDFNTLNSTLVCEDRMTLKISLYTGPCYITEFNGNLEFMGATMTTAHTIRSRGGDGEVILPQELLKNCSVKQVLENNGITPQPFELNLDPSFKLKLLKIPAL